MLEPFSGLTILDLRRGDAGADARVRWRELCERSFGLDGEADQAARMIVARVRREGDAAIIELTQRFEGRTLTAEQFEVPRARALGCWDFVRYTSVLELGARQLQEQARAIIDLARAEGLEGHARAVQRRLVALSAGEPGNGGRSHE